jgi:hypothetical protein
MEQIIWIVFPFCYWRHPSVKGESTSGRCVVSGHCIRNISEEHNNMQGKIHICNLHIIYKTAISNLIIYERQPLVGEVSANFRG